MVEGESLINDGTALVAYKFAVAAVVTGSFSALDAGADFVVNVAGGIAVGIAVGAVIAAVRRRLDNPPVEVTIALLSGLLRLPARGGDRGLGRARRGHRRHLHGPADLDA